MLKEGGRMDMDYLTRMLDRHKATYIQTSPVILQMLADFFHQQLDAASRLSSLKILSTGGAYHFAYTLGKGL